MAPPTTNPSPSLRPKAEYSRPGVSGHSTALCGVGASLGGGADRDPSRHLSQVGRGRQAEAAEPGPCASHWGDPLPTFPLQLLPQSQHFIPPARSFTTADREPFALSQDPLATSWCPKGLSLLLNVSKSDTTRLSAAGGPTPIPCWPLTVSAEQPRHAADAQFLSTFLPNLSGCPPSSGVLALTPGEGAEALPIACHPPTPSRLVVHSAPSTALLA